MAWSCVLLIGLVIMLSACATPHVHTPASRHAQPSLNGDHAVMEDGYQLPLSLWPAETPSRAVVLAVHGMNDYSNSFDSTGTYLAKRGITLVAYDQRGFGATDGQGLWHGSGRLVDDIRIMSRLLRKRFPGQPLYLLGESMGGAVVLASLNPRPPDIDGIILIAPAVWSRSSMPYYQRALLWLAAHTVPGKELTGEGLDIKPSDNIEMLRALGRDPLVIKGTRVDVLYGVTNLMDRAQLASSDLSGDTLILYGQHDDIIPKQPTCDWLQSLPADALPHTRTVIYKNGYHMLTRDLQADTVLQDIAGWLLAEDKELPPGKNSTDRTHISSFCVH
jgi:alpha-beta hydrolase superfamily lysophospholipase